MSDITTIIILIVCLICLIPFLWTFAPYFPTRRRDLKRIAKVAALKPGQTFYELGCGDAGVSLYLARQNPDVQFIGYEIFFPIYCVAKLRSWAYLGKNLKIYYRNVFWQDLSKADWIYTFGMKDGLILKLRDKLQTELQPGSHIISYTFKIPDWNGPEEIFTAEKSAKIYRYTK